MGDRTRCSVSCAGSRTSFCVVRNCLMRCAYQACKIRSVQRRPDKAFTPHPAGFISHRRKKAHPAGWASSLYLMPGSSLLSHGETPHYHRRYGVSLLSSAWGQVGPPRYSRQANSVINTPLACRCHLYQAENLSLRQNIFGVVRLSLTVH